MRASAGRRRPRGARPLPSRAGRGSAPPRLAGRGGASSPSTRRGTFAPRPARRSDLARYESEPSESESMSSESDPPPESIPSLSPSSVPPESVPSLSPSSVLPPSEDSSPQVVSARICSSVSVVSCSLNLTSSCVTTAGLYGTPAGGADLFSPLESPPVDLYEYQGKELFRRFG